MTTQEKIKKIKDNLAVIERTINSPQLTESMKEQVKTKRANLEKELAELEGKEEPEKKPEPEKAKKKGGRPRTREPKEKGGKRGRPSKKDKSEAPAEKGEIPKGRTIPMRKTPYRIDPEKKVNDLGKNHELKKASDEVYQLYEKGNSQPLLEFEKRSGKWHVQCVTKDKKAFNTLQGAVNYVAKTLYRKEVKEYIKSKKKSRERAKKWRAKHPSGETSPSEDVKTATKKAGEKIKEKADDDKPISKDINAMLSQIVALLKDCISAIKDNDTPTKVDRGLVKSIKTGLDKLVQANEESKVEI